MWQLLSDLYQSRNQADWQYPEQLRGRAALDSLGQQTTEYEHSIEVDLSEYKLELNLPSIRDMHNMPGNNRGFKAGEMIIQS